VSWGGARRMCGAEAMADVLCECALDERRKAAARPC